MALGIEYGWVAVGFCERVGDGAFRQSGDFVQHGANRIGVEIAIVSRVENLVQVQDFEKVECDVTDVGDVVAQGISFRTGKLLAVWLTRTNVRNRNLR